MANPTVLRVAQGFDGWSFIPAIVDDGERRVIQVARWTGGTGNPPIAGQYVGSIGLVDNIADAVDIRGQPGGGGGGDTFLLQEFMNPGALINVTSEDGLVSDVSIVVDGIDPQDDRFVFLAQSGSYLEGQTIRVQLVTNIEIPSFLISDAFENPLPRSYMEPVPANSNITWLYQLRDGNICLLALSQ